MLLEPPLDTAQLKSLLDRFYAGDEEAADMLLRIVYDQLERLTRQMLRGFPNVRRRYDASDVLHGALVRMLGSLRAVHPVDARSFLNLAALNIRRELLDLARRFRHSPAPQGGEAIAGSSLLAQAPSPESAAPHDLDLWSAFHEHVEQLPSEEREVLSLTFYHDWTQFRIAELLGIDERTVRRRWRSACLLLRDALQGQWPEV